MGTTIVKTATMRTKRFYLWASLILFITEVFIAIMVPSESFIRHSLGDFLVVILMYCFVKVFLSIKTIPLILGILEFSFIIEFSQYFHVIDQLGITNNLIRIIVGTSFSISDLLMYGLGCLCLYLFEVFRPDY